ncbi:MAG: peptidoglycan endopeptidase [Akkermansia sp.]
MSRFHTFLLLCAVLFLLPACVRQGQQQRNARTPMYVYHEGYTARLLPNGKAGIPRYAPARVKRAIAAANRIVGRPYRWGGGHGKHESAGYDCSGSVAYVLREAGMLKKGVEPTSGYFLRWGRPGFGKWITVYAKRGHVFALIAGLRFDTTGSGAGVGPRWYTASRGAGGFYVRRIPGY